MLESGISLITFSYGVFVGKRDKLRPGRQKHSAFGGMLKKAKEKMRWLDPFTYADILLLRIGQQDNKLEAWPIYLLTAFITAWLIYTIAGFILGTASPAVVVMSGSMEPTFYRGDIMILHGVDAESLKAPSVNLPVAIGNKNLYDYAITYCELKGSDKTFECRELIPYMQAGMLPYSKLRSKQICFPSADRCVDISKENDIVVYNSDTLGIPVIHRVVVKLYAKDGTFVLTKGDSVYNPLIDQEAGLASGAIPIEELQGKVIFAIPKLGYVKLLLMDDLPCIIMHPLDFMKKCRLP